MTLLIASFLLLVTVVSVVMQLLPRLKKEREAAQVLKENTQAGVNEPPSLHPVIDEYACLGCGSCVDACPEQPLHSPLGLVGGKAVLVDAPHCIGHGACRMVCSTGALELVFGTEKRGVDIPNLQPNFETNVPGLFIAGELGGMGLVANAIDQGVAAVESIRKLSGIGQGGDRLDVVVVGAGPSGFAASLAAKQAKLRCRTVEQGSLGGTVFQFPRGKIVMTRPVQLPLVGKVKFTETSKEKLLEFWQTVERDTQVEIHYNERLEMVTPDGDGFVARTTVGEYRTRAVLLCLGRTGTPRKLGVPGEDHPKVVYRLIDSREFAGKSVLVVGGGDSALEAAHTIADEPGAKVTLSYREKAFTRAKEKNRKKVEQASHEGRLHVLYESKVKAVHDATVDIEQGGTLLSLPNEAIIVCAGGILPTPFLKEIGIGIETKFGTR
jgi:thioredoxin reductase/NAD-dependent dihydropyrimidine dehydrogenase PreA subunit